MCVGGRAKVQVGVRMEMHACVHSAGSSRQCTTRRQARTLPVFLCSGRQAIGADMRASRKCTRPKLSPATMVPSAGVRESASGSGAHFFSPMQHRTAKLHCGQPNPGTAVAGQPLQARAVSLH